MKTNLFKSFSFLILTMVLIGCTQKEAISQDAPVKEVLTKEKQDALTPQAVLEGLKAGNERFVNNSLTPRDYKAQVVATAKGQYPEAVIISCLDSRVPVELVFDKGIGDVFVGRIAGNNVNTDMLGSIEFGTALLSNIKPAIAMSEDFEGERSNANNEYVSHVVENNVRYTIAEMRKNSPMIAELEKNGDILIAGAFYDLDTGKVTFLEN